jgi:hypothetical protein
MYQFLIQRNLSDKDEMKQCLQLIKRNSRTCLYRTNMQTDDFFVDLDNICPWEASKSYRNDIIENLSVNVLL